MTIRRIRTGRGVPALAVLFLVLGLAAPAARAQEAPTTAPSEPAPTPAYLQTVDITFPTDPDSVHFTDTYDACRSGCSRYHKATDIMGEKLVPEYAAVDGTICYITGIGEPMPSWGYNIDICGDDGRTYHYLHINNDTPGTDDGQGGTAFAYAPGIVRGVRVERGQLIAWMGDSGNAESTAPHLHFEIHDDRVDDPYGSHRLDPYPSLMAALDRGDVVTDPPPRPTLAVVPALERVYGSDRVATAVALSAAAFDHADEAVLAPATTPAEAIVAGPLAAELGGPVLTMVPGSIDDRVVAELARLGTSRVTVVGDVLDDAGRAALAARLGIPTDAVTLVTGRTPFDTAGAVARRVWELQAAAGQTTRRALVALGTHPDPSRAWPDSLVASWDGAATGRPVLLVSPGVLPGVTRVALEGVDSVTIVGGTSAVATEVADAIDQVAGSVDRLWGPTRYSTALAVAGSLLDSGKAGTGKVWGATGRNWPDAVTSGPAVARLGQLLVLVDGADEGGDGEVRDWLAQHGTGAPVVGVGGAKAVADGALRRLATWTAG